MISQLRRDLNDTRRLLDQLQTFPVDQSKVVVVIAVGGKDGDRLLANSLRPQLRGAAEAGVGIEFLIGANNGEELPRCRRILRSLDLEVQIARCQNPSSELDSCPTLDLDGRDFLLRDAPHNRATLVHQSHHPWNAGKPRALRDLYGLILRSMRAGWTPPAYLFASDAETRLVDLREGDPSEPNSALRLLLEELEANPSRSLVGTVIRFARFPDVGDDLLEPSPDSIVPPIQLFLNLVHGWRCGYRWLPGSGTLGRTSTLVSILHTIVSRYRSPKIEDVQTTVLADQLGLDWAICQRVCSLNRCGSPQDADGTSQMKRWISGCLGLRRCYGSETVDPIANPPELLKMIVDGMFGLLKGPSSRLGLDAIRLLRTIPAYQRLKRECEPDDLDDSDASWGY